MNWRDELRLVPLPPSSSRFPGFLIPESKGPSIIIGNNRFLDIFSAAIGEVAEWSKAALC